MVPDMIFKWVINGHKHALDFDTLCTQETRI